MRFFHLLLPLLFCVVFSVGSLRADDSFTLKSYPVDPEIFATMIAPAGADPFGGGAADPFGGSADPFGGEVQPEPGIAETEHIFKLAKLPEGSELRYLPRLGRFFARTSKDGHERLKEVLDEMKVPKLMVEIDFSFIGVNSNEVLRSEVFQKTGSLDSAEVMRLFKEGKASLISMNKIVTLSGVNAQVECVHEIIYPTEFEIESSALGGSNRANSVSDRTVIPGAFETREIGTILNVTPTIAPNRKHINLALIPEKAEITGWIDYALTGAKDSSGPKPERPHLASQPVFRSFNVTTSLVTLPGLTVVVGGGPHPTTGQLIYSLVTARLIDVDGQAGSR